MLVTGGSVTTDSRSVADPGGGLNKIWAPTVNIQIIPLSEFGPKQARRNRFSSNGCCSSRFVHGTTYKKDVASLAVHCNGRMALCGARGTRMGSYGHQVLM